MSGALQELTMQQQPTGSSEEEPHALMLNVFHDNNVDWNHTRAVPECPDHALCMKNVQHGLFPNVETTLNAQSILSQRA